jgi:HEPN domain-containing protein
MNAIDAPKVVLSWLQGSEEELKVAHTLAANRFFAQAHFHLHLSLEKLLKALVVSETNVHAPYSHQLSYLVGKTTCQPSETQLIWLGKITDFNLSGRYTEEKQLLQRDLGEKSWTVWSERAKELRQWLLTKFP